ncbi:MAG TPA: CDP-alcohol phosphatidyltransferase family protein, partial [Ornithinibacter sp.]|nr:CDP-alcohol phosphatidyltransferase family protein [Ornithinibacter sp.]
MSRTSAPPPVDLPTAPVAAARGSAHRVRASAVVGLAGLVVLLVILSATTGLGGAGWVVGLGCGAALAGVLVRGLARAGRDTLGPADLVTLGRALLACGVAALTAESLLGHDVTPALLVLTVPALVLDAVDGRVARRTGTVTAFGGRFDGEVDAFLILVLSVAVAPSTGWWVLAAGLARYAFAVAGWALPWMRGRLEFRYWRKVVTATVGVVLTVAVADVLPRWLTVVAVVVALALLAESFGRDVWWLWRHRPAPARARPGVRAVRLGVTAVATVLSVALVWFALVAPTRPDRLTPGSFVRLPVEAVVVAALALVASGGSSRSTRAVTVVVGTLLSAVALLKILDLGAFAVLDRPFNLVTDRGQLGSGLAFVRDSMGPWAARGSVVAAALLVGGVVVSLPWAFGRLTRVVSRHRRGSRRAVGVLAAVWVVCAASGVQLASGGPVAAADTGPFVVGKVRATTAAYRDRETFERELAADAFADPASGDLSALRGKDVVVAFVESYGRVALEGHESSSVRTLVDAGTVRLRDLGYTAASAYLGSPTFGGSSWLAHATLQSGLEVGNQGH